MSCLSRLGTLIFLAIPLVACSPSKGKNMGIHDGRLLPCPTSPNCVSSDAAGGHHIEPYHLATNPEDAWRNLMETVSSLPRARWIETAEDYAHAEFRSALFGFVDDTEFLLLKDDKIIAVRSASRVGYADLGANRKRIELIRTRLRESGVIR